MYDVTSYDLLDRALLYIVIAIHSRSPRVVRPPSGRAFFACPPFCDRARVCAAAFHRTSITPHWCRGGSALRSPLGLSVSELLAPQATPPSSRTSLRGRTRWPREEGGRVRHLSFSPLSPGSPSVSPLNGAMYLRCMAPRVSFPPGGACVACRPPTSLMRKRDQSRLLCVQLASLVAPVGLRRSCARRRQTASAGSRRPAQSTKTS